MASEKWRQKNYVKKKEDEEKKIVSNGCNSGELNGDRTRLYERNDFPNNFFLTRFGSYVKKKEIDNTVS